MKFDPIETEQLPLRFNLTIMSTFLNEGYFALFLIIALGLMLGNVKYKGFSLDSSAVIFVALLMGRY